MEIIYIFRFSSSLYASKFIQIFFPFLLFSGDVQPIAGQLIELAKKKSSSDNISVIVVFLKDPHQIVAEHKLVDALPITRMDFESTNGCHQFDDGLLASNRSVNDETPSPDKMHVDFNKATVDVHHHDPMMDANDFYFGKNGEDEFHANINTIPSSITSNGDGDKLSSNELNDVGRSIDDDHDDFGPETDVDATDDNAISPLSPSVSYFFFLVNIQFSFFDFI